MLELKFSLHDLLISCISLYIFNDEKNPRSASKLWHAASIEVQRLYKLNDLAVYLRLTRIQNKIFLKPLVLMCIKERVSTVSIRILEIRTVFICDVFL